MASNEIRRGAAEMVVAMMMSGTIGWLVMSSQQPLTNVVFFRCLFGAATLAIVCAAFGFLRRALFSPRMLALATLGSVAIVANWLLLFAAYSRASISMATAVYNTQPFMLVALGAIVFRERITASTVAWLALAFVGRRRGARRAGRARGAGRISGRCRAVARCGVPVCDLVDRHEAPEGHAAASARVAAGRPRVLLLAPFAHFGTLPATAGQWLDLVVLGVVNTGLMYVLLYGAIQKLPTAMTGALSFVYPVVAIVVDHFAFGQTLAWTQVVGALLILLAAAGVNLGWRIVPARRAAVGH